MDGNKPEQTINLMTGEVTGPQRSLKTFKTNTTKQRNLDSLQFVATNITILKTPDDAKVLKFETSTTSPFIT